MTRWQKTLKAKISDPNRRVISTQVTWSIRPKVAKVNIRTVGDWCKGNVFKENHGHGVRSLVTNPDLLSTIQWQAKPEGFGWTWHTPLV